MERLTEHSKQTSHENGICCTHFRGPECLEVGGNCAMNCKWEEAAWSRLAAYEDTGLTPKEVPTAVEMAQIYSIIEENKRYRALNVTVDRIRELAKADKDGRIVVLPCKVGDTVYRLQYVEESPGRFIVGAVPIKFALIWLDEFGKTVFLTREEAEEALRGV